MTRDRAIFDSKILIVDDEFANNRLLERILERAGFTRVRSTTDPHHAVLLYSSFQPDIILLDLQMPNLDGFGILRQLEPEIATGVYVPIVVLTADITPETRQRALSSGAKDFLTKPFDRMEVLLRITNLLEVRHLYLNLENRVRERTQEVELAQIETLQRLAVAAELRDDTTARHTQRVGDAAASLARVLGLREHEVELLRQAGPLHDVGKLATPDAILLKPGKLTPEEFVQMQRHTTDGAALLAGSRSPALQLGETVALAHHERWDGTGYPAGLKGEAIPLPAQIVSIVDVYDALTHQRPYKRAWPVGESLAEIERQSGRQFDPHLVKVFLQLCRSGPSTHGS
ncbi:MAG: HD domain-containing phosphohydrolase [Dehalococcoidia bacterium]